VVFLAVLLSGIPGSQVGSWLTTRLGNPVHSLMLCDLFFIVSTSIAASTYKIVLERDACLVVVVENACSITLDEEARV
jgi:hypothetical protein